MDDSVGSDRDRDSGSLTLSSDVSAALAPLRGAERAAEGCCTMYVRTAARGCCSVSVSGLSRTPSHSEAAASLVGSESHFASTRPQPPVSLMLLQLHRRVQSQSQLSDDYVAAAVQHGRPQVTTFFVMQVDACMIYISASAQLITSLVVCNQSLPQFRAELSADALHGPHTSATRRVPRCLPLSTPTRPCEALLAPTTGSQHRLGTVQLPATHPCTSYEAHVVESNADITVVVWEVGSEAD